MTTASAGTSRKQDHFDPYALDPKDVLDPPTRFGDILKKIGPGIVLSASIVGSGELIATTTLGAEVGYTVMWLIVFSCLIKALVQSFLGRYTIAMGETGLEAFNRIPGRIGRVNWVVWAWAAMVLVTLFQICAMFIGVSQVMKIFTGIPVFWWVIGFFILTLILLLGGAYHRIERLAMVKVGLFTLITLLSAVVLTRMPEFFSWSDVWQGFTFSLPDAGLATALAVFGITGVGATELYMYTYWCVEKGYARYTGPHEDSEAWQRRARGWVRVMNVDVICSMIIYTVATIAFYLLGAGILHGMGVVPKGSEMIITLSNIYTQTLGDWAKWLFYIGAIVVLYGTIFAATAGHSRMFADFMRLQGAFARDDFQARHRWRDIWIVLLTAIPVVLYFIFGENPVGMVKWGGYAQAWTLPVISLGTVYLIRRHLPKALKATPAGNVMLWIGAIVITGFVLMSEARRLGLFG
ncbi:MAG TPA: Nramp family divalent metal transporter [Burkholderiales bacterium]|nr:Nramp family divalent metal transporter [Burkholderiales bacterium]